MALKQDPVYLCPTQGNKIESVVIRECTLVFFLVLNRVRVQTLSGSLIPKHWWSTHQYLAALTV